MSIEETTIENVLSLFDGISGGQIALERLGIVPKKYFASEIDQHAIAITQKNFPNTIQLGDVKGVDGKTLPKIDLIIGGSPCQSLSIASRSKQSGLTSGKSTIFYEYVRLLREVKPKYFLLENVASMKKKDKDEISKELGVQPILINSKDFSGQLRSRLYWTNIPQSAMPAPKNINMNTLLDNGYSERSKAYCITATYSRSCVQDYFLFGQRQMVFKKPVKTVYKDEEVTYLDIEEDDNGNEVEVEKVETRKIAYFTTGGKTYRIDKKANKDQLKSQDIKSAMRKMTPQECEKLQCLDVDYTKEGDYNGVIKEMSNPSRYHAVGNGWTISVIEHILENVA
jgi:DNA (cytosine-5)-methyltransferase 3A